MLACWLLQAPSLGTLPLTASPQVWLPSSWLFRAPAAQTATQLRSYLWISLSDSHSVWLMAAVFVYLRWLLAVTPLFCLWQCRLCEPLVPLLFFFFSVPPSHPALVSFLSFAECEFGNLQNTAASQCSGWIIRISFLSYVDLALWRVKIGMQTLNYTAPPIQCVKI